MACAEINDSEKHYWELYEQLVDYYRQIDLYGEYSLSFDEREEFEELKKEIKEKYDE